MEQILYMIQEIENMEDFIKISSIDFKIDKQVTNELLRLLQNIKEIGLK
jgi:hypothetical protein